MAGGECAVCVGVTGAVLTVHRGEWRSGPWRRRRRDRRAYEVRCCARAPLNP